MRHDRRVPFIGASQAPPVHRRAQYVADRLWLVAPKRDGLALLFCRNGIEQLELPFDFFPGNNVNQ